MVTRTRRALHQLGSLAAWLDSARARGMPASRRLASSNWWIRTRTWICAEFDADREAMLERAREAGVRTILAIAADPRRSAGGVACRLPSSMTGFTRRRASIRTRRSWRRRRITTSWRVWRSIRGFWPGARLGSITLRSFAARRAAARFHRAAGAGAGGAPAGDPALPRGLDGLPGAPGQHWRASGAGRHLSLLYGHAGGGASRGSRWDFWFRLRAT